MINTSDIFDEKPHIAFRCHGIDGEQSSSLNSTIKAQTILPYHNEQYLEQSSQNFPFAPPSYLPMLRSDCGAQTSLDFDKPLNDVGNSSEAAEEDESKEAGEVQGRKKFRRWRHKEYQCDDCDRMFTLKHNLQNHLIQYHMGCKTLHKPCSSCKCTVCGKIYSSPSVLADHMLEYHDVYLKKEQCTICAESFATTSALNRHMKQEHYRKMKRCPREGCEELEFRFSRELNEHMREKHRSPELVCSVCDMTFKRLSMKVKHERNHMKNRLEKVRKSRNEDPIEDLDEPVVHEEEEENTCKSGSPTMKRNFEPQLEAVAIKRKVAKKISREMLAKIKN